MRFTNPKIKGCFEDCGEKVELSAPAKKRMTHQEALDYASASGNRLPTKEEIHLMLAMGIVKVGDISFWSASVHEFNNYNAWIFKGNDSCVYVVSRVNVYAVRCIGR